MLIEEIVIFVRSILGFIFLMFCIMFILLIRRCWSSIGIWEG